jgi:hypothetical protein
MPGGSPRLTNEVWVNHFFITLCLPAGEGKVPIGRESKNQALIQIPFRNLANGTH